jgi:hypothetical protein
VYSSTEGDKLPTYNRSGLPAAEEDEALALDVRRVRESDCMVMMYSRGGELINKG